MKGKLNCTDFLLDLIGFIYWNLVANLKGFFLLKDHEYTDLFRSPFPLHSLSKTI